MNKEKVEKMFEKEIFPLAKKLDEILVGLYNEDKGHFTAEDISSIILSKDLENCEAWKRMEKGEKIGIGPTGMTGKSYVDYSLCLLKANLSIAEEIKKAI